MRTELFTDYLVAFQFRAPQSVLPQCTMLVLCCSLSDNMLSSAMVCFPARRLQPDSP